MSLDREREVYEWWDQQFGGLCSVTKSGAMSEGATSRELYRLACELEDTKQQLGLERVAARQAEGERSALRETNDRQGATITDLREQLLQANDRIPVLEAALRTANELTPTSGTFGRHGVFVDGAGWSAQAGKEYVTKCLEEISSVRPDQTPSPSAAQVETAQWVISSVAKSPVTFGEAGKALIARAVQILTEALA